VAQIASVASRISPRWRLLRCLSQPEGDARCIVAGEGATFHDVPHFAGGIVPGDGIFTTWSYRAGAGRVEAFLLNPQPLTAQTAHEWGVIGGGDER
jgi:hypothetical protein